MVAKRRLNFGSTPAKRMRLPPVAPYVMQPYAYRSSEMKFLTIPFEHVNKTTSNLPITAIAAGADNGARVGSRLRLYNIEYLISSIGSGQSVRFDIVVPNNAGAGFGTIGFDTSMDRKLARPLLTKFLHSGTNSSPAGTFGNVKIPGGLEVKYGDSSGIAYKNIINAVLNVNNAATITGYCRVWYTDG